MDWLGDWNEMFKAAVADGIKGDAVTVAIEFDLLQQIRDEIRGLREDLGRRAFAEATPEQRARNLAGFEIDT